MTIKPLSTIYSVLLVVLIIISVYYINLSAEILSVDDNRLFTWLLNLDNWSIRGLFAGGGSGYYYRPLITLSFIADNYLWGQSQSFMHLENILLHACNAALIYFIASEVARKSGVTSSAAPFAAALLFGLNPLATEPVNWISGRTDLLAGIFLFAGMLILVKGLNRHSTVLLSFAVCSLFTAILAKETALFWYPAGMYFVYCFQGQQDGRPAERPEIHRLTPYALITIIPIAYFVLRHLAFSKGDGGIDLAAKGIVAGDYDFWNKIRVILKVFGFYIRKLFFPFPLNFGILSVSNWYVPVGIVVIVICLCLFYRRTLLGSLLIMSCCLIVPALLVPLGRMAWTPVAERYLYMPAAFFTVAVVVFIFRQVRIYAVSPKTVGYIMVLFVGASALATFQRNLTWHTNRALFADTVEKSPSFSVAKNELARALALNGQQSESKKIFLANTLPAEDKFSVIPTVERAKILASENKIEAGIKLLTGMHYTQSQPMYDEYVKALISLYGMLEQRKKNPLEKRSLHLKRIALTKEYQAITGDPFLYYQIGKLYLGLKNNNDAAHFFHLASVNAPVDAFYKAPAEKLARRLGNGADEQ